MAINKLSELTIGDDQSTICVLVSRRSHFRGGTDEGPIIHTDLVLIDSEVGPIVLDTTSIVFCHRIWDYAFVFAQSNAAGVSSGNFHACSGPFN